MVRVGKALGRAESGRWGSLVNILIVEDNPDLAQTMGWIVESFGHTYSICLCGADAEAKGVASKPDVVIMDIGLPDVSGYDLCQRLRAMPTLERTVFIAQSGRDDADHYSKVRTAGFHHHLVKPASFEQIGRLLEEASASLCN